MHTHICAHKHLVSLVELQPSLTHFYQPLWTLVGGGFKDVADSMRPMGQVMPAGVAWLHTSVTGFNPDTNSLTTADGNTVQYEYLVVVSAMALT